MKRPERPALMHPKYNHRKSRAVRRYFGMLFLVSALFIGVGIELSLAVGIRTESYNSFSVVPRAPIIHSYNPIYLVLRGLPPTSSLANPLAPEPTIRAIVVSRDAITLLEGGTAVRVIHTRVTPHGLIQVVHAVHNKAWVSVSAHRSVTLSAALVTQNVHFTIGSRFVREVLLRDLPSVFIGAQGGTLLFRDVSVRASNLVRSKSGNFRPFVMARANAAMNIVDSRFSRLGWNWNASYGVSWMLGATGRVVNSTFENNFIGAYTDHAVNLTFSDDTFRNNALYGLDPHTYSTGLKIVHVTAEYNKAIGIIFAEHVTRSVIRDSISQYNGEDGIMMYESSSHDMIVHDSVSHNTGDGLVVVASPDDTFADDVAIDNRIGVRVEKTPPASVQFTDNRVLNNGFTSQGVTLGSSNTALNNGGQWNWRAVREIWTVLGILLLLFSILFALFTGRGHGKARSAAPATSPQLRLGYARSATSMSVYR
jgi:mannuronan 5-epimerase